MDGLNVRGWKLKMDVILQGHFEKLDEYLTNLARSDSSVQYASFMRNEFDGIVESVNEIKIHLGDIPKTSNSYFGVEDDDEDVY